MGCCIPNSNHIKVFKNNTVTPCQENANKSIILEVPKLTNNMYNLTIHGPDTPNADKCPIYNRSEFGISIQSDLFRRYSSISSHSNRPTNNITSETQSVVSSDCVDDYFGKKNSFQNSKIVMYTDKLINYLNQEASQFNVDIKYLNQNCIKIDNIIASGSTSDIYLGYLTLSNNIDIKVAVKKINKKYASKKNLIKQISSEIIALNITDHKYIVKYYGVCITDTDILIVIEYCENSSIHYIACKSPSINEIFLKFYMAETVIALQYLHSIGIIHRDIKEDNILIGNDGHIRLTDFGCAKIFESNSDKFTNSYTGTPFYMSPLIKSCKEYSFEVDWYSLGLTIQKLISPINNLKESYSTQLKQFVEYLIDSDNIISQNVNNHIWFSDLDWIKFKYGRTYLHTDNNKIDTSSVYHYNTQLKSRNNGFIVKYRRNSL